MSEFKDWNVIITGSSEGIGLATAKRFLELGAKVIINGRSKDKLAAALNELSALGTGQCLAVQGDISDPITRNDLLKNALEFFDEKIDVLVNNVGGGSDKRSVEEISEEDWRRVMEVNLGCAFFLIKEVVPIMKARNFGRIINISSIAGKHKGRLSGIQYSSSKAGMLGMTRHLAWDLASFGITVNAISPGFVNTARALRKWELRSQEERESMMEGLPIKRFAEPSEIAHAITFLASEKASYITGISLDVNGGAFMN